MTDEPITLRNLTDVALAAPFMLGYWPEFSAVVIVVDDDGQVLLIMRWHLDAPEVPPHLPLTDDARAEAFHVIVYGGDAQAQRTSWSRIASEIAGRGIPCGQVLFAERDGADVLVRGAQGAPSDPPQRITGEEIAQTGGRWNVVDWAPSRAEYIGDITPDPVLVDEVTELLVDASPVGEGMRDRAISAVCEDLIRGPIDAGAITRILVSLSDVRVRDTVLWDLMHSGVDNWSEAADGLAEVVSGSPDAYVAPAATILAILRWQQGDGSRAAAAVERALDADPSYSLADLINRSLLVGLHPATWAEGLAGLSREACRRAA